MIWKNGFIKKSKEQQKQKSKNNNKNLELGATIKENGLAKKYQIKEQEKERDI